MDKKISDLRRRIEQDPENPELYLEMHHLLTRSEFKTGLPNLYKFTFGDWSGDGHRQSEAWYFVTNLKREEIIQSYFKTAKKVKVAFHRPDPYHIPGDDYDAYEHWGVCCNYEDNSIPWEILIYLKNNGINLNNEDIGINIIEEGGDLHLSTEDLFKILMIYIKYSNKDFKYELKNNLAEPINGFWQSDFNLGLGYGLFY